MLRLSWAIALGAILAALTGILIVTGDLNKTEEIFADGVAQAKKVDATTDEALAASLELPAAKDALGDGLPEVVGTIGSLEKARGSLGTLAGELQTLGGVLASADRPLGEIIGSARGATGAAGDAAAPAKEIVGTLKQSNQRIRALKPLLNETLVRSQHIEAKLRWLLLLPQAQ
ncbi:hypothetical protein ABZV31_37525 [Streptomyces sp. NPDC005202]|uniref:hypothetical protein n=1 Tax=Streptomyces sp. NPDC005202 TaxID=3157021 RepID=UPI0033B1162B